MAEVTKTRAYTPTEVLAKKIKALPLEGEWERAFGCPNISDNWFIDGESASGKSTFVMRLGKMLTRFGKVAYLPLEEGLSLSLQRRLREARMEEVNGRFVLLPHDTVADLIVRLAKPRSPQFIIIDSVQYMGMTFRQIKKELIDRFPKKSFIFVSQNYGGKAKGKTANDLRYDAGVKVSTRGFRAYCSGRFVDDAAAYYTIWPEGAARYYLNEHGNDRD